MASGGGERRPATPAEARALANPLRLRILRLCLDDALTNREIAAALGAPPGTTLHHVRLLVETGFLRPAEARKGRRGANEKPYQATGKSWELSIGDSPDAAGTHAAMVDAFRAELVAAGPERTLFLTRFANRLDDSSLAELTARVDALVDEFARRDDEGGRPMGFLLGGHVRDA